LFASLKINTRLDLLIVGAGPAGLTLAWKAAERGVRVVVVDQKPSADHVAYLTSASFMDLGAWGIPEQVAQPIETLHVASRQASVTVHEQCWVYNRRRLLAFLAGRAEQHGARLLFGSSSAGVAMAGRCIRQVTVTSNGAREEFSAGVFADCSGTGQVLERHVGLVPARRVRKTVGVEYVVPLRRDPHTLDFYFGSQYGRGYGWLFPLDDRTAVLGYGTLDAAKFQDMHTPLHRMLELPRVKARVEPTVLEANGGVFRTGMPLTTFHQGNLIVVGDVALQGNPVIGEGIRFVMDAAHMAADAVVRAVRENRCAHLGRYSSAWVKKYYHQYRVGYLANRVTSCLTAEDQLCDEIVNRLRQAPPQAVVRVIQGDIRVPQLLRRWLRLCLARLARAIQRRHQRSLCHHDW
jgi:digeranylgeranylglycerophospholipid reductase